MAFLSFVSSLSPLQTKHSPWACAESCFNLIGAKQYGCTLSYQWRPCWRNLGVFGSVLWHVYRRLIVGRDGFVVSAHENNAGVQRSNSRREPTAGGQYHWVAVFAPKKWRKFASYVVG